MERRQFTTLAAAALLATLVPHHLRAGAPKDWKLWVENLTSRPAVTPSPEITAAVDVLVPADPDIPADFKGTDYGGDWLAASVLGQAGQFVAVAMLNSYAQKLYTKDFATCTPGEQLEAIKAWVLERETLEPLVRELLSGLLTLSVLGTYEGKSPDDQAVLFAAMGWFDPDDPDGTFRVPNEGFADSFQFPAKLKKGLLK